MEALPTKVFRRAFQTQLLNHLRPPSRADLGTHARKLKPIQWTRKIVDELLSFRAAGGRIVGHLAPVAGWRGEADEVDVAAE